jgi:hypothetical protein
MIHDPIPHRDGEWDFDGSQWRQNWIEANKPMVQRKPLLTREVPTWMVALVLALVIICIAVPPLARAAAKALA